MDAAEPHTDFSLRREERMRSKRRLERLFKEGQSGFAYPLRYICLTDATESGANDSAKAAQPACVLFSVPKKFHKRANKRNLLRRRMREAYRLNKSLLAAAGIAHIDLALVYSVKDIADYKRIEYAVKRILSQIAERM